MAGGTGTFIGTSAAFNAVKATLPVNTVAYITDDGNGDLQPVDAITNGDMHPVTSNAVYDAISPIGTSITANPYPLPVTLQPNAPTAIGEITLTPGSWIVIVSGWHFIETPENILYICLDSDWFMSNKPSTGWEVVGYYKTSTNKVVKVNAYNSTNSAIAVANRNWKITAIKLS